MPGAHARWIALVLGLAGLAVGELVWAPAGVGLTFAAAFVGFGAVGKLNVTLTRVLFVGVGVLHGLSIARGSGSWLLGLGPAVAAGIIPPYETLNRRLGYHHPVVVPLAMLAELALGAASWPPRGWHLALVPSLVVLAAFAVQMAKGTHRMRAIGRGATLRVGDLVADFTLPTRLGRGDVTLSSFRGRYVLLCLLRGDWCPVCQVMMRIIAKDAKRLEEHGVQVIAVGAAGGDDADDMARFLGADYLFVVDERCTIAAQLGTVHRDEPEPGRSTNLPALMLVDPAGRLAWLSTAADVTVNDPSRALRFVEPAAALAGSPAATGPASG